MTSLLLDFSRPTNSASLGYQIIKISFMKAHQYLWLLLVTLPFSCSTGSQETTTYSRWVGDIPFDKNKDDSSFKLCNEDNVVHSRHALDYDGGKNAIKEACLNAFQFQESFAAFSGYIVIRFIRNCEGETGRFRVQTLDEHFASQDCPKALEEHLLGIVKTLKNWKYARLKDESFDCSKYLNFKINNGKIDNILH